MKCPRCHHHSETGAEFCEECAAPFTQVCAKCCRQLSPTATFCPECANPTGLPPASPPAQRFDSPSSYTPQHLAEKILTSKSALGGKRLFTLSVEPSSRPDSAATPGRSASS